MLKAIAELLGGLVDEGWAAREKAKAAKVKLFRRYYNGEHRLKLTKEMKRMMQISDDVLDRYNANYCDLVVHTMADRIHIDSIDADEMGEDAAGSALAAYLAEALPDVDTGLIVRDLVTRFGARSDERGAGQMWVDDLLDANQFNALEQAVTIGMLRDGVTYVLSEYREDVKGIRWHHETAFDGDEGIIVVWDSRSETIQAAVKVYRVGSEARVTLYYPDKVQYYSYGVHGEGESAVATMKARSEEQNTTRNGKVAGIPLVAFRNKVGDAKKPQSELRDVIPLQDSLNRGMASMVINAELTAFSILLAVGIMVDAGFTPGMVLQVLAKDEKGRQLVPDNPETAKALADYYNSVKLERVQGSPMEGFIGQCDWFINQISVVSSTPMPATMGGDTQSGEALKQREVGLLGKVRRAHVHLGNGWRALLALSHQQQGVFGITTPPAVAGYTARWKDAQIRNDADIQMSADWYMQNGFARQALRVMSQSSLATHTEADIDRLLAERARDTAEAGMAAGSGVPGFEQFAGAGLPELIA